MINKTSILMCIFFGIISFYYFNKYQESKSRYDNLHKSFEHYHTENRKMKSRIKDLESYKNDVSKTFQILDNELVLINDNLKRRNTNTGPLNYENFTPNIDGITQNVSLLTPQLLASLFNMNSEEGLQEENINELQEHQEEQPSQEEQSSQKEQQEQQEEQKTMDGSSNNFVINGYSNSYDKFLLNN